MSTVIHLKRDYSFKWAQNNPVLEDGEPGYELDTGILKIGNGDARWLDLDGYAPGTEIYDEVLNYLSDHVDFIVLFENSLA